MTFRRLLLVAAAAMLGPLWIITLVRAEAIRLMPGVEP
jgi:hypothetical protein